jgi:hypothetical protein
MASYVGGSLLFKKSAAVLLLLLGIVLIVIGQHEGSFFAWRRYPSCA